MYIAILGRQPALGVAELEQIYGAEALRWFSDSSATIDTSRFDFNRLGGTQKAGRVVAELSGNWQKVSMRIVKEYAAAWASREGKITLGISAYGFTASPREIQKTGIILKSKLKEHGVSLRLVPNAESALNTATSHHNKLGLSDNHVELLVVRSGNGKVIVAESVGAQNITALSKRDQARPRTDSFVGMLPPKLARMMVNYATEGARPSGLVRNEFETSPPPPKARLSPRGNADTNSFTVLDPFCGTGVLLQEAALLGFDVYGTDLAEKMVRYSTENLDWLTDQYSLTNKIAVDHGDAMNHIWQPPIDAVATETYLGQPFSAPPSPAKLTEVRGNCNHIISEFLKNIAGQLESGTPLCVAVPAWRDAKGTFTHLPLTNNLSGLGFVQTALTHVTRDQLLYYREDQVVARELLLLKKA